MLLTLVTIVILTTAGAIHGCDNNWVGHGSSCYHFSHDKQNWVNAMEVCKLIGGYLVEINDQSENSFVSNRLKNNSTWIGLADFVEEGVFAWMTSKTGVQTGFWGQGEPNNANGNENCVAIISTSPHLGWNDDLCTNLINYVCEKPSNGEAVIG